MRNIERLNEALSGLNLDMSILCNALHEASFSMERLSEAFTKTKVRLNCQQKNKERNESRLFAKSS